MSKYEVNWADGIVTRMTELNQSATYAGMLEGVPTREINERFYINPLVNPENMPQRLLLWAPQNEVEGWPGTFMGSPTAALPAVRCLATFDHFRPARDETLFASYIRVAWFQEEWALPIIPEVLAKIKSLKWRDVAIDYDP